LVDNRQRGWPDEKGMGGEQAPLQMQKPEMPEQCINSDKIITKNF
jgi:hypothetical protein